jgi:hypothetical protein
MQYKKEVVEAFAKLIEEDGSKFYSRGSASSKKRMWLLPLCYWSEMTIERFFWRSSNYKIKQKQ